MQLSVRSPLIAGFAAWVVAASVVGATPGVVSSGPRLAYVPVVLSALADQKVVFSGKQLEAVLLLFSSDLFDPSDSYTYVPNGSGPSVSHPVGLIPQLVGDLANPPVLTALINSVREPEKIQWGSAGADIAAFGGYATPAAVVIGQKVHTAVHDTFTPTQWGGGKVLNDWNTAAAALEAETVGVGDTVNGT